MQKKGIVYLIGAGPGDPGLLTVKGLRILQKADVVIYDRLVGSALLSMARSDAEMIYVGKASGHHALPQEEINQLLVEKASQGLLVARLKGGDPFLFGRGGEEAQFIRQHGLEFEIVPGVTSAIAVPAYAGIPVTHRDDTSSFAVITGHEKPGKKDSSIHWDHIATGIGTLVFLMGVENLPFICDNLIRHGRDAQTPIALIRWGTRPEQEVLTGTLDTIVELVKKHDFKPPAVIVVGEVVNLRQELSWLESKPLWGKRIVVTRSRAQASQLVDMILDLGGEAIEFPSIEIRKETNLSGLHNALSHLHSYDWLVFTSVNAVDIFFEELMACGYDIRDLKGIKLAAIGPATQERLTRRGLRVEVVPEEYRAEGIIKSLLSMSKPGQWVLLPRARGARTILPDELRQAGLHVNEVFLYEAVTAVSVSPDTIDEIKEGNMDYITFTSSSTVHNFVKLIGKENVFRIDQNTKVACIGPITADTARGYGFTVDISAQQFTIQGLIDAIVEETTVSREEKQI
ncbi:MAG: uroporphyrinogen-III C-methyltransferase [Syntrophomonadaceae bacterium]|nr:uroporphyrinogen-III C-methyltransferase [Syntrophomonadaceae bacterium]